MSINHLCSPDNNNRLDIYVNSLTLTVPPTSSSKIIEFSDSLYSPEGHITINNFSNIATAEVSPCKVLSGTSVLDKTLVTMTFTGTVNIANLPVGQINRLRVTIPSGLEIPLPSTFSILSGYISTAAGSVASGSVLPQDLPISFVQLVFPNQFDIVFDILQTNDASGSYNALNQPYSIKVSYFTL